MYKDVWRKFGIKIVIIFCSIMLLGGVAVAAPRIQATFSGDGKPTVTEIEGWKTEANGVVEAQGDFTYNYGEEVDPESIHIKSPDGNFNETFEVGSTGCYKQTASNNEQVAIGTEKASITVDLSKSGKIDTSAGSTITVEYEIKKKDVLYDDVSIEFTKKYDNPPSGSSNPWIVTGDSAAFLDDDWNVQITKNDGSKVKLVYNTDYFVEEKNGSAGPTDVGPYNRIITFRNYSSSANFSATATVYKDASSFSCTVENGQIKVKDGNKDLEAKKHYVDQDNGDGTHTIIGLSNPSDGIYYTGRQVVLVSSSSSNIGLATIEGYDNLLIEYKENGESIEKRPSAIYMKDSAGNRVNLKENTNYNVTFDIIDGNKKLTGATAGTAEAVFQGISPYTGTIRYRYGVRRELILNELEKITLEKAIADDDMTYDGQSPHVMNPVISFKNTNGYRLRKDQDYDVYYSLTANNGQHIAETKNPSQLKDAGTVWMKIVGKAGDGEEGYYGTLEGYPLIAELRYDIEAIDLKKGSYSIKLINNRVEDDMFDITCQKQDVIDRVHLVDKSNHDFSLKTLIAGKGGDYEVVFKKPNGEVLKNDEWGNLDSGTYTMEFKFNGNFVGDLTATFQIEEYEDDDIIVVLSPSCSEDGNEDHHVYNKSEHQPLIESIKYKGKDLTVTDIDYDQNINAGTNTAIIRITLSGGKVIERKFTIATQALDAGVLQLTSAGFTSGSAIREHEYCGKQGPSVPTLTFVPNNGGRAVELNAGEDFTILGLYDEQGNRVTDYSNVNTNTKYHYEVTRGSSGNFVNTKETANPNKKVYTEYFKFTRRSINKTSGSGGNETYVITYPTITPMEYDNPLNDSDIIDHIINNMVLTDTEFGDVLRKNVDYRIENISKASLDEDGTITFTIVGINCYSKTRPDQKLNVGKDIVSVLLKEKNLGDRYVNNTTDREVLLTDLYTQRVGDTKNPFNIKFNTTKNPASDEIAVYDGNKVLCEGSGNQYRVRIDATIVPDPNNPDTGEQYAIATLTGINGYYNSIKVRFRVGKINLERGYEIYIINPTSYFYTGQPVIANIVVRETGTTGTLVGDPGVVDPQYYDATFTQNIEATNNYNQNPNDGALVTVVGKRGFEGTLRKTYNIQKRPINSDGKLSDYFKMKNFDGHYKYRPQTIFSDGTVKTGTWADFELVFSPTRNFEGDDAITLVRQMNGDYTYECTNAECVTTATDHAQVTITAQEGNFSGKVTLDYDIDTVDLQDPSIEITMVGGNRKEFTGEKWIPELVIHQKVMIDGKEQTIDIPAEKNGVGGEYTLDASNSQWVSSSIAAGQTNQTYLTITPKVNKRGVYNYANAPMIPFVVYGKFDPAVGTGGIRNSKVEVKMDAIPYSENIDYGPYTTVEFYQKAEGATDYGDSVTNPPRKLTYRDEYYITCNDENETVGIHSGYIRGYDDSLFVGRKFLDNMIVIQGNLSTQAEVTWNRGSNSIPFGQKIKWDEYITVTCGGKELKYNVDYQIRDGEPDFAAPGEASIVIEPTKEAAGNGDPTRAYLINEKKIDFNVTTQITNDNLSGLESEYVYTGRPVINVNNIVIKYENKELKYNEDYTIEGDLDATNAGGPYTIIIKGKSSAFLGSEVTHRFTIVPYNIENNPNVTVKYDPDTAVPEATYTGSEVLPKVAAITVATSSGSLTLNAGDENNAADYEIVASGDADHVNWTNPKSSKPRPQFTIRGIGNFTGSITKEYTIKPRRIDDADVIFDDLGPFYYDIGKPITPKPTAKYGTKQLTGILYNNNDVDKYQYWEDDTIHFTYQYRSSLTSIGTKTIHIMGIGNFIGEKDITYVVEALDIDKAELRFKSDESPIYDGVEQRPAFELLYNGERILEWTGTQIISEHISTADIKWTDNIDASDERKQASVTISLAAQGDNYYGSKSRSFMIQPASLENHVKFMHLPAGQNRTVDLNSYKLSLPFIKGQEAVLNFAADAASDANLTDGEIGIFYNFPQKANHGAFLGNPKTTKNFTVERVYVEPDTDDVEVREGYGDGKENNKDTYSYAGKIKYTITGTGNYKDTATFWYYVGTDISSADVTVKMQPTTAVYNSTVQAPEITVSGVESDKYTVENYKNEAKPENRITRKQFIDAATYYIRIEGQPWNGTYASNPQTYTYTITPRPISSSVVIDGFKKEYPYTGLEIRPVGISVTDYIDRVKYRLTEDLDYTLSYSNNLNAGTAFINVECKNNFSGTARANFLITSSTISSGSSTTPNTPINGGTGEISGSKAISPNDVILTMDTANAMHYTGNPVYPKVSIAGMTENVDYTVTFSNNTEVGTATVTITGIGNNRGTITKTFNIIAPLSNCKIAEIPAQQYTGSAVEPTLTVTCGKNILIPGTDYNVTYANNINIGTATATIRAASNSKYTGSASVTFSIANDVGDFIISGYAPTYTYTGNAITPSVVVETGSGRLTQGTDYTISYSNNINAGKATITVKGVGRYSGTKTATFIIEAKSIQGCTTTEVEDRTYTGDAYTPTITVTDGNKVLTSGVDYTVTYTNNTEPGTASILIQGMSNNYSGTKVVNFKIGAVAVKGLKATNVKYNSLKLKWTKQGYADGYQICDAQSKVVKNVTKNSVTLKKLATGKTYRYKVRSYIRNADGTRSYGAFSSVVSATTKLKTPEVEIVSKKTGQARITWSKVSGANGYEIYYKKSSGETYRKVKTVNNANVRLCRVRGMKSGDKAYFRVRAFKKTGSKKVYSSMNKLKVITVK